MIHPDPVAPGKKSCWGDIIFDGKELCPLAAAAVRTFQSCPCWDSSSGPRDVLPLEIRAWQRDVEVPLVLAFSAPVSAERLVLSRREAKSLLAVRSVVDSRG